MSVLFSIIVFISLNVVPVNIDTFELVDPTGSTVNGQVMEKVIRFERNEGGGWRAFEKPDDELGRFTIEGNNVKVSPPGIEQEDGGQKEMVVSMDSFLEFPEDIEWASIARLDLKHDGHANISRAANEVSVDIAIGTGEEVHRQNFIIRWEDKK